MSVRNFTSPVKQLTPGLSAFNDSDKQSGKRLLNGWTKELQDLAAEWADHAACYEYMHEQSSQFLYKVNLSFKVPIIILSFLTGSTNIGLAGFFNNDDLSQKKAQWTIGAIGILVGMLGALDIFFKFGQECEAHHTARINWGNFHRIISFQLKLHPNERIDAIAFMKMMQNEMSRLIVQSPKILQNVISSFNKKMKDSNVKKPSIVNGLEHIVVFDDKEAKMVKVVEEVMHLMHRRKGFLKDIVIEELENRLKTVSTKMIEDTIEHYQTPKEAFFREELEAIKQELCSLKSSEKEMSDKKDTMISPTIDLVPTKSKQLIQIQTHNLIKPQNESDDKLKIKPASIEFIKDE
jgi:hypothetical protein